MRHHQDYFAAADGTRRSENVWLPDGPTRATVLVQHGFTEHAGRYAHVAEALTARDIAVYAADLRGHGQSDGPRAWIASFDEYLDDVETYLNRVRAAQPAGPVFLLGHSLGGTIAALGVAERSWPLAGLVLSAAAIQAHDRLFPVLRRLASLVSRLWPRLRIVRMGTAMFSRDPDNTARFQSDSLVFHGRFPVRTGAEILRAMDRLVACAGEMHGPLLSLQGTGDAGMDPAGSQALLARAGSSDKTLKLYPGLYHDLLGEPERAAILAAVLAWIEAHLLRPPAAPGTPTGPLVSEP